MEGLFTGKSIRTFTGIYMNVFEPTIDMICIEDIAHALSNICRFGGHLPEFYSVAQHSYICSKLATPENKFAALMHDASEAYLLDIPRPIKHGLSNYKDIEDCLMRLIAEKFGFDYPLNVEIKRIDKQVLQLEFDELVLQKKTVESFKCFSPGYAKQRFLDEFHELTKNIS